MKAYREVEVQLHTFLTWALVKVIDDPHALAVLPLGKNCRCAQNKQLNGSQSRSGHFGKYKNSLPLPGFEPVAVPTAVYSHSYKLFHYYQLDTQISCSFTQIT
jgi:hypothetical protein